MNKFLQIFLGILTAMGGFVEVGEMVFTVTAGAKYGFRLLWVVALGTLGIMVYGEMAGRIAAVAHEPVFLLIKERLGYWVGLGSLVAANVVNLLTCAAEIGGVALVLKLLFGTDYYIMALCATLFLLAVMWLLSLEWIERVFGLLGLLLLVFVASAVYVRPDWSAVGGGFIPNLPLADGPGEGWTYAYFAVALMSSIMLPYETYFYSSGAIEDNWKPEDVTMNRLIVGLGFCLGGILAVALVIAGAQFFGPEQIEPQLPGTVALSAASAFGKWALVSALGGMFFAFGGAAIETALSGAYNTAQFFAWPWGKSKPTREVRRFTVSWVVMLVLAIAIVLTGVDPISVVEYSIIFAVVILPLTYLPILITARDKASMGEYANGPLADTLGLIFLVLITLAALAAIPLFVVTNAGKG